MEVSLQEALQGNGFGKVKIVRLENTEMGVLGLTGQDENGVEYKLVPAKDANLPAMVWPGDMGTDQMRIHEGVMNLLALAGPAQINGDVFVGPAVHYSPEVNVDETGAALWTKVD